MRVLLVNKFFHPVAGAETAFFQTRDLLLGQGNEVIDFAMRDPANLDSPHASYFAPRRSYVSESPPLRRAIDATASIYSLSARRSLARLLDHVRPDVAHLHNVYHQLTLSVVDELEARAIPIVLTLHDWKIACPSYTLFTDNKPCRRCQSGSVLNAVRFRCVKGSIPASAVAAAEAALVRRRRLYQKVHRLISPSRFGLTVATMAGADPGRLVYLPNFLSEQEFAVEPRSASEPRVVYVGRLEITKGIPVLLEAFRRVPGHACLRIAGAGALESAVRRAATEDTRIVYLGHLPRDELFAELSAARVVVLPAVYEDNAPMSIIEAQARAKPVIVSDRGGLPELVDHEETGLVVPAGDASALAHAIRRTLEDPALAETWGRRARELVQGRHSPARHYRGLREVYMGAMSETS